MINKKIIYCDMDGVLADFNGEPNAVKRFAWESGFFKNLKPIKNNVNAIKELIADGFVVRILSASPNENADKDKIAWLKKYLPEIADGNIIIIRNGENKSDYVKADGKVKILFDDYWVNCEQFKEKGFIAYKINSWHSIKRGVKALGL